MKYKKKLIGCISDYKSVLRSEQFVKSHPLLKEYDDKFKITKHKQGDYPAIVTISGFCSEDFCNEMNWKHFVESRYPDREWFHVEWNAEKWPFSKTDGSEAETNRKRDNSLINLILSLTPAGRATIFTKSISNNFWHRAVRNARVTGEMLAIVLDACPTKNYILAGHSLGARIIFNCLRQLNRHCSDKKIVEAHLFGGAVGNNSIEWKKACKHVYERIYNYYSSNDMVLRIGYSLSMLSFKPIGLDRIAYARITNHDFSGYIKGHSDYFLHFDNNNNHFNFSKNDSKKNSLSKKRQKLWDNLKVAQKQQDEYNYNLQKEKYG